MRCLPVLLALAALPARADIEPGNWEITSSTTVQGIREPTSLVQTRCITPEEARDPSRLFGGSPGAGCRFVNRNDTGSVFTFELSCDAQPPLRGSGAVRYAREALEGELELTAESFAARSRITARRLGGC